MKKILLSVKPKYAKKILAGEKTVEYRKRIPTDNSVTQVLIYASYPIKRVVAEFTIGRFLEDTPKELWRQTRQIGGISEQEFANYFNDKDKAYAYVIKNLQIYTDSKSLSQYGIEKAPQDFCYVDEGFKVHD